MTFAHPWAFWLGLAAVPIVLLYRMRLPRDRQPVATGMFWEQALAAEPFRARWQRWRHRVSLAVALALVAALTLAAAGPQIPRPEQIVLIIDNSAGMSASDVEPSRLAAAKAVAYRLIDCLRADDHMAILAAGGRPTVVCPPGGDGEMLRAAVESLPQTAKPAEMTAVLEAAAGLPLPPGAVRRIVVLSDGCFAAAAGLAAQYGFELMRVGTPVANRAITRWTARRSLADPRVCEVLAETRNHGPQPAECRLSVALDGKSVATVDLAMKAEGRWQQVFELTSPAGGRLTARLDPPDAYPADNMAEAILPPAPAYRVTLEGASEKPVSPLRRALEANPLVQIGGGAASNGPSVAIHVFEGQVPATLPDGPVLAIGPGPCDQWQAGPPIQDATVARLAEDSPILSGVRMLDVYLGDARRLEPVATLKTQARPLLWTADGTPLGLAIDRPAGRVVVLSGSLDQSNLGMQTALPILIANALDWLAGQPVRAQRQSQLAGEPTDAADAAAGLDLRAPAGLGIDAASVNPARPWPPARLWPAVLALAILVIEWCLYQRRWTS